MLRVAAWFAASAVFRRSTIALAQPVPSDISVLEQYRRLFERIDTGPDFELLMDVVPLSAPLKLSDRPIVDGLERLKAFLQKHQAVVADTITLSVKHMEPFPSQPPPVEGEVDAHMRHPKAWIMRVCELLLADIHRAWGDEQVSDCAERLIAAWNIAAECVRNPSPDGGLTLPLAMTFPITRALFDAGFVSKATAPHLQRLLVVLRRIDPSDPYGWIDAWRRNAEQRIVVLRGELGGPGAGDALSKMLREAGINEFTPADPDEDALRSQIEREAARSVPHRSTAESAKKLTSEEISHRLDDAAALIPDIDVALRSDDPVARVSPLVDRAAEDQTHIARLVLGAPGLLASASFQARNMLAVLTAQLERALP